MVKHFYCLQESLQRKYKRNVHKIITIKSQKKEKRKKKKEERNCLKKGTKKVM